MVNDFFEDIFKLRPLLKWSALFLLSFLICYLSRDFGFFWDNIIHLSIPANWFYSSGLNLFTLPVEYTTLHSPLISIYLFFVWSLCGKTLFVSHMAMFPFVFGFLWQLWVYICWLLEKDSHRVFVFFVVLIDATILSQLSLISFEIALLFFLFAALNSVNQNRNIVLAIAFAAHNFVSVSGILRCPRSLFIFIANYGKTA